MIHIGLDIGGTQIKGAIVAFQKGISEQGATAEDLSFLRKTTLPANADDGPEAVISQVNRVIGDLISNAPRPIAGIGVGVPGAVDADRGIVSHPPNFPGWHEIPLIDLLQRTWNLPVRADNDANCAAIGEAGFGAGRATPNFIALTLGTGVGAGIILGGCIYRGGGGYAGEFGHITIERNGRKCNCGNQGCIEAYAGSMHLVARARESVKHHPDSVLWRALTENLGSVTPRVIADAAAAGDAFCGDFLHETGELLGIALASAANLLDIETFIIGGGISAAGKALYDGMLSSARRRVLEIHRDSIRILQAALGNDAGIIGAAAMSAADTRSD